MPETIPSIGDADNIATNASGIPTIYLTFDAL